MTIWLNHHMYPMRIDDQLSLSTQKWWTRKSRGKCIGNIIRGIVLVMTIIICVCVCNRNDKCDYLFDKWMHHILMLIDHIHSSNTTMMMGYSEQIDNERVVVCDANNNIKKWVDVTVVWKQKGITSLHRLLPPFHYNHYIIHIHSWPWIRHVITAYLRMQWTELDLRWAC